ncbi:high-affinity phosphodiesterase [Cryptococcus neoformans Bt15]|nr:high-affinity phosphodiesterase [Cryptococcus neoformans var. grubii Bt15]
MPLALTATSLTPPSGMSGESPQTLSVLVLLPSTSSSQAEIPTPYRPNPLKTRSSSPKVPTVLSLTKSGNGDQGGDGIAHEAELKAKVMAGRRLSLGSSLGSDINLSIGEETVPIDTIPVGINRPSRVATLHGMPPFSPIVSPTSSIPPPSPKDPSSNLHTPPFGYSSRSGSGGGPHSRRRRPQTASGTANDIAPALIKETANARSSLAMVSGAVKGRGKARPGWEADELVGHLRESGLEVTVVHTLSHLTSLIDPDVSHSAHPIITRPADPAEPVTHVILVPLADSPAFPSLSLLVNSGTTPSAVCFQQDILERAIRAEEQWLKGALAQIKRVADMCTKHRSAVSSTASTARPSPATSGPGSPIEAPAPLIIAYSANPSLSQSAISACITAGVIGVLKPPYDLSTAEMVRRMVWSYKEGELPVAFQSPFDMSSPYDITASRFSISPGGGSDETTTVVLPPTALDMGAEHEGEKILAAAMGPRQGSSEAWNWARSEKRSSISQRTSISRESQNPSRKGSTVSGIAFTSADPFAASCACNSPSSQHLRPDQQAPPMYQQTPTVPTYKHPEISLPPAQQYTYPYLFYQAPSFCAFHPAPDPRRRSVDIGGLAEAIKRASRLYEASHPILSGSRASSIQPRGVKRGQMHEDYSFPSAASPTSSVNLKSSLSSSQETQSNDENDAWGKYTELAELLSAMYCHTGTTIDVQMEEFEKFSNPLTPEKRSQLVDELATWNFKPHYLHEDDLYRMACSIFEGILNIEGLAELGLQQDNVNRLLFAMRAIYHAPNPYHNYVHALDVLQATYTFLADLGVVPPFEYIREWGPNKEIWRRPSENENERSAGTKRAREIMRPQDILAVLIAAMGHDVGHPGLSNAFMKNARVPLSQVYEDKSVLENMHCMLVVQLLRKYGFGFLIERTKSSSEAQALSNLDQKSFRQVLYSSILATDMSLHFAWVQRLKEFDDRLKSGEAGAVEDERILICQALIKCADISNPSRPIGVSQHWSSVLLEEWAKQASLEQDLSLPVSVVASADAALQAKGQIGFIDLFTKPLFEAVSDALPELQPYADSCVENQTIWKARLAELTEKEGDEGEAVRTLIQPAVEGASQDERFKTLFPLLLPTPLVSGLSVPEEATLLKGSSSFTSSTAAMSPYALPTPSKFSFGTDLTEQNGASPAASVMRAVYHAKLVDQGSRSRLASWSRGFIHGDWNEHRRMSTPEILTSNNHL